VGADDDDVLKAGTERFERIDSVVVEEEQGAVEGQGARRGQWELDVDTTASE
jgi:hypothetical protein